MRTNAVVAALVAAMAGTALAQTGASWRQRVHPAPGDAPEGYHNCEVALGVNREGTDVMVAWIHLRNYDNEYTQTVWYNVATDGETFTQTYAGAIPGASAQGTDPMVAFSRTTGNDGSGWVGQLEYPDLDKFFVARKAEGDQEADTAVEVDDFQGSWMENVDKPLLAVGPSTSTGPDLLAVVFSRTHWTISGEHLRAMTSTSSPLGDTWSSQFAVGPGTNGTLGGCATPLILQNGTNIGRWVVGYQSGHEENATIASAVYRNLGDSWANSTGPTQARNPGNPGGALETIVAFGGLGAGAANTGCLGMAVDPANAQRVYMAFCATTDSTGEDTNGDIFIAQSTDGGETFPGSQVLHITDADLGETSGRAQFMPAITVDANGGVNILYYSARLDQTSPAKWYYQAKYARVGSFVTNPHPSAIAHFALADEFHTQVGGFSSSDDFLGHYNMADSRGCNVYLGYASRHEGGANNAAALSVYVSKV
jgi:hypothetical protein